MVFGRDTWSDVDVWCRLVTDIGQDVYKRQGQYGEHFAMLIDVNKDLLPKGNIS